MFELQDSQIGSANQMEYSTVCCCTKLMDELVNRSARECNVLINFIKEIDDMQY